MNATRISLKTFGEAHKAFTLDDFSIEKPKEQEVQVKVAASGLNFADIMARRGMYAPVNKLPFTLGYDVVGEVTAIGENSPKDLMGKRVISLTRFGGYQSHVNLPALAVVPIPDEVDTKTAISYTTAFLTAFLMVKEFAGLSKGKTALIYSAAGGVGYFLYHFLKMEGVQVQPVVGSDTKIDLLKKQGIPEPILKTGELENVQNKYDLIFNARGGKTVKADKAKLNPGGKLVMFGAAEQLNNSGILGKIKLLLGFGFYSPIQLIVKSQSLCGFNLLGLSSQHPITVTKAHKEAVIKFTSANLNPLHASGFKPNEIGKAHALLESGKSTGKLFIDWQ